MKGAAEPDVISDVMCAERAGQSSASSANQPLQRCHQWKRARTEPQGVARQMDC